ncbi:hypothetical protein HMF8227_02098 [Saliniradius amylolyticus]|uniref:Flagellar FliJ protein n=1 Tax=Saliniradius amylolyticus TaxID=2183582 RepID=A0A2S2E4P1_9ALTE|nr:flagellar export protein FliJ [Saliniradius amylolyticus]AWL12559.1 hypothetical protein HMF8227_02098 [Saliniradius amylolyticus]
MSIKQLQMVAEREQEQEDRLAREYQHAQQNVSAQKQKLTGLNSYRLDYLREVHQRASSGVGASTFGQHQAFIDKLDMACLQQSRLVAQSQSAADQRKQQWLKQQQKRKAVELLLEKKYQEQAEREARQEQQVLDEFAIQRFLRQRQSFSS